MPQCQLESNKKIHFKRSPYIIESFFPFGFERRRKVVRYALASGLLFGPRCKIQQLVWIGSAAVLAAACGASTGSENNNNNNKNEEQVIERLENRLEAFDITHVKEQGYWYSRYNLGSLVMKSGLGDTFPPDMNMMPDLMAMVSDGVSQVTPPENPALLKRVFNSGDPTWANASNGNKWDFGNERWVDPLDQGTTAATFGWTMMKETQWAKQFHVDEHFGVPNGSGELSKPGADQRFSGLILFIESVMQAMEWINNPGAFTRGNIGDDAVALAALSDLVSILRTDALPHSSSNRYREVADMMAPSMGLADADALADQVAEAAKAIYDNLGTPGSVRDRSLVVFGLAWYGNVVDSATRGSVKNRIDQLLEELAGEEPTDSLQIAYQIRGMIAGDLYLGKNHEDALKKAWKGLIESYDGKVGRFTDRTTTTCDDNAVFLGALNAMFAFGPSDLLDDAEIVFRDYFEAAINMSGFQLSAPPMAGLPEYEHFPDELFHRYPSLPMPPMAGGANGIAPVFSSNLYFSDGSYGVDKDRFDSAGAMHLANEMIWFHVDEVNGFPEALD